MSNSNVVSESRPVTMVLKYTDIRSYIFTLVFVSLSVLMPWAFHQFHLAGATFLPMHIFVLAGGLVFGWRAGLVIGGLSPLLSYSLSGMPALTVLPQVLVELTAYGVAAGLLREKLNLPVAWSLVGAMVAGRLVLTLAVSALFLGTGEIYSPLGAASAPLGAVWSTVALGWPGMVIQLALIPSGIWLAGKMGLLRSSRA